MGMIRQLTCPSCHKTWQICTGHGMRHGTLGRVMEVFSEDIQREIAAGAAGGWLPLFHFDYRTAICGQCRDVVAVPVLRLIEKDQTYVGTCPVCGGEAEIFADDSPITCPSCQGGLLKIQESGRWD